MMKIESRGGGVGCVTKCVCERERVCVCLLVAFPGLMLSSM